MAKEKYNEDFPLLAEGYARQGLTDVQIAENFGISESAYYEYQKRYPEFMEAIKRGKSPVDIQVENALLKRALGFEYEETHTEVTVDNKGETKPTHIKRVRKQVPPDVGAIVFWLKNRKPGSWRELQVHEFTGDMKTLTELVKEAKEETEAAEREAEEKPDE